LKLRLCVASGIAVGVLLCLLVAEQMPPPMTPFSADLEATSNRGGNIPHEVNGKFYLTRGRIRMDIKGGPSGDVIWITNATTHTSDMLMPAQHMYVEFKTNQATHRPGMAPNIKPLRDLGNPCADEQGTTCKKVGVEQVNGRTCDHWAITQKDGAVSNVWVNQELHFPIKTVTKGDTWQLTNIKEGEPAASLFVIPAGYRKMEMPGMQPPSQ
jgi:uncharacterized protein DUF4412